MGWRGGRVFRLDYPGQHSFEVRVDGREKMSLTAGSFIKNHVQLCPSEKNKLNLKKTKTHPVGWTLLSVLTTAAHFSPLAWPPPNSFAFTGAWKRRLKRREMRIYHAACSLSETAFMLRGTSPRQISRDRELHRFSFSFFFSYLSLRSFCLHVSGLYVYMSIVFFSLFSFFFSSSPPPFPVNPCHIFDGII